MGDEVPNIQVHLHNNAIDESGLVWSDIRSVGGRNEVRKRKNTPCLSERGHVLP